MGKVRVDNGKRLKRGIYLTEAFLVSFALVSVYGIPDIPDEQLVVNGIYKEIYNLFNGIRYALNNNVMNVTVCFIGTFWLLWKYRDRNFPHYTCLAIAGGVVWTAVKAYKATEGLTIMFETNSQMLVTCMNAAGYSIVFNRICIAVSWLLHKDFSARFNFRNPYWRLYRNHPFLSCWIVILLAWSIHIIVKYPGAITVDNWGQLAQYNGMFPMNSHWPPFHTVLLGFFVYTGESVYSMNLGLFSYVIMQWLVMSAIMAYTLNFMRKYKVNQYFLLASLILYCVCPLYTGFVGVVEKDVLYAAFYVLFVIQLMEYILNKETFWTFRNVCLFIAAGTLVCLLRKNGSYVIIPTLIIMGINYVIWIIRRKNSARHLCRLVYFIGPIVLSLSINHAIAIHYDIVPGRIAEALSIPIQQTARYIRDYKYELSDSEREILSEVFIDVIGLSTQYEPGISDPVKGLFKSDVSKEDMIAYLKLWGRTFWKHPLTYIEATLAQNYYLFDVNIDNYYYYRNFHMASDDRIQFHEISWLQPWHDILLAFYRMLHNLPVIGILSDIAFYMVVFVILLFVEMYEKNKRVLSASIPFILSMLIIIAGPVIYKSTRYALQMIYAMPSFVAFCKITQTYHDVSICKLSHGSIL